MAARSRNIKPGFFVNELLSEMPFEYRLLFIGLWTFADREGRFEYRPKKIKAALFPYDDVDVEAGVTRLIEDGFILKYVHESCVCCQVLNWNKHQKPHHRETQSLIPAPDSNGCSVHEPCMSHASSKQVALCPTDSGFRIPDSGFLIPDSVESPELAEPASEPKAASRPAECDGAIPVMQFPVVGKGPTEWTLTKEKLDEYHGSFPGIDCLAECRKARQWCLDNPKKRKTAAGMTAFLGGWLSREQNRAARLHPSQSNGENKKPHRIQLSGK